MDENDDAQKLTTICQMKSRVVTNPIIDFSDREVWEHIRRYEIPMNPLYARGYRRVGCIGCPMNTRVLAEFNDYPKYKAAYIRAFEKMIQERERRGKDNTRNFRDAQTLFRWWTEDYFNVDQLMLDGFLEDPP